MLTIRRHRHSRRPDDSPRPPRFGAVLCAVILALLVPALSGCAKTTGATVQGHAEQHLLHNNRAGSLPRPNSTLPISTYTGNTPWNRLKVGDCVDDLASGNYRTIYGLDVVNCVQSHDSEIYAMPILGGAIEWPGDTFVDTETDALCNAAFTRYVGVPVENTELDYSYFPPNEAQWQYLSERYSICVAFQDNSSTIGSVKNTGILGNLASR
jgi:hypothetical protein